MRLARIGLDEERGYLQYGVYGWIEAGFEPESLDQIDVRSLNHKLQNEQLQVLDVRRTLEWETAHIEGSKLSPLDEFKASLPELDKDAPVAVICKGGYRSMIACSLLLRAGFAK